MKMASIIFLLFCWGCTTSENEGGIIYPVGGYDFINPGNDSSFSDYPLRKIMSRSDSFTTAWCTYYFFKAFDEINISLRPAPAPIFKFYYVQSTNTFLITLTQDSIVSKTWLSGYIYPERDPNQLTDIENRHFNLFERFFPLNEAKINLKVRHNLDSIIKASPELLSAEYYRYLQDRISIKTILRVSFSVNRRAISKTEFTRLINLVNASGYWAMPYSRRCSEVSSDGGGFILAANTGFKYNSVTSDICESDSGDFRKACREIVKAAGIREKLP